IAWGWVRGTDPEALRVRVALAFFSGLAMLSVWYYPDYIHLSIVAPVSLPLLADTLEAMFRVGEAHLRLPRGVAAVTTLGLLLGLGVQLAGNLETRRRVYPFSHETAFGRVDFRDPDEIVLIDALREVVGAGSREVFVYPYWASLYLTTATRNPTRFQ